MKYYSVFNSELMEGGPVEVEAESHSEAATIVMEELMEEDFIPMAEFEVTELLTKETKTILVESVPRIEYETTEITKPDPSRLN